ncbi:MAG: hypothetical protein WC004_03925 [Candidatus Absconditabacterales bacterium]
MIRKILIHAYLHLVKDSKLITLSLSTMFAHSFIFVLIILYNLYFYLENEFNLHTSNQVIKYVIELLSFEDIGWKLFFITVILFFGYFVLAPIGEGAIVKYLHADHKKSITKAISEGTKSFFAITKYEAMTFAFNVIIFLNILSKVFVYELDNILVFSVLGIWLLFIILVTCMFQFTKTIIILEGLPVMDAIKKSFYMSFENLAVTIRLVVITMLFNLRLLFNVIFVIGIPLAGVIILQVFGVVGPIADTVVYILFFSVLLFLAYINTLIEGYFRIYRYLGYLEISGDTERLEKLGVRKSSNGGLFDTQHIDEMKLLEMAS